ncbi:cell death regulator Aven [Antennarius striatus]|uniref:cell death regulator Aven n=1 Tax=Antennarius striatus TaxID=241820 RepID=UPI0035AF1493
MEVRPSRGRGGSWKRGDRGRNSSDSFGGEARGRGRGGHHRGRGKRDHQRGRGRGGNANLAEFHHRNQEGEENVQEEDDRAEVFSRRKLESNWDRYEESEKKEAEDDVPTQRGTDYHILLESAGDSFTQFRFSEEKDREMESFAISQMSDMFLDLPALADLVQQVPLHQRLNLEPELVQVATPLELPTVSLPPKQRVPKLATFAPPPGALKDHTTNQQVPTAAMPASDAEARVPSCSGECLLRIPVEEEEDEELDQLLSLQKTAPGVSGNQYVRATDTESVVPEKAFEEVTEKMEEVEDDANHTSAPVRKEVTEEDLEDWLDSMIS